VAATARIRLYDTHLLERLHYGFRLRPWFSNVTKTLRKEPKWFLRRERHTHFLSQLP
jgi:hypothetical protein